MCGSSLFGQDITSLTSLLGSKIMNQIDDFFCSLKDIYRFIHGRNQVCKISSVIPRKDKKNLGNKRCDFSHFFFLFSKSEGLI